MATVPSVTQRQVLPDSGQLPYSNPEGQIAKDYVNKALVQVGGQIKQASNELEDALLRIQDEDAKREARKLDTEMSAYARLKTYGDGTAENPGYLNLLGENAVNGYAAAQADIDKKAQELRGMASNGRVANMFTIAANERLGSLKGQWLNHTADQRMKANQQVNEAHMKEAVMDAASNWANPAATERGMAILQGSIADQVSRGVLPAEAAPAALKEAQSSLIEKVVLAATIGSTAAAKRILATYAGEIDGLTAASLKDKIHSQDMQNLSDSERYKRIAEAEHERVQDANFDKNVEAILLHQLPASELADQIHSGDIDGRRAITLRSLMNDEYKVSASPTELNKLRIDIYEGRVNSLEDVMSRGGDKEELSLFQSEKRNGGILHTYDADQGRLAVEAAVGGEKTIAGEYTDPQVATRVQKAYEEYNQYIRDGKDWQYARDHTIGHYQQSPASIKTAPRPLDWQGMWPPSSREDLEATVQRTAKKLQENATSYTPAELQKEFDILKNLANNSNLYFPEVQQ